jgi:hypothetical protein
MNKLSRLITPGSIRTSRRRLATSETVSFYGFYFYFFTGSRGEGDAGF